MKDYTLNTHTLPFRTTIVIAQNKPIEGTPALRERFVNTEYDRSHFSEEGRHAGNRLKAYSVKDVSGYLHELLSHRDAYIDAILEAFETTQTLFRGEGLQNPRTIDYYALVYAGMEAMGNRIIPDWEGKRRNDMQAFMLDRARKQERMLANETDQVRNFFEDVADFIIHGEEINHSSNPAEYALCLKEIFQLQLRTGERTMDTIALKNELKDSPRYIAHRVSVRSSYDSKVRSCWIFKKGDESIRQKYT